VRRESNKSLGTLAAAEGAVAVEEGLQRPQAAMRTLPLEDGWVVVPLPCDEIRASTPDDTVPGRPYEEYALWIRGMGKNP
jgi:hypothetical protein